MTSELLSALHDSGLFRLLLEKRFDGAEVCPSDFSVIIEEVAKHDASTAWCLCQANGCTMTASFLNDDVANEIWGHDPKGVVAWGPGKSEAVPEGDGFRVNAKCAFASGGNKTRSARVPWSSRSSPRHPPFFVAETDSESLANAHADLDAFRSAAAALGGFLASLDERMGFTAEIEIAQGVEIGRPGAITVSAQKIGEHVGDISIAGRCAPVMHGTIEI